MVDIFHDLPVNGRAADVFAAVSTPEGLSRWWSRECSGTPAVGEFYEFDFGPDYQWTAKVIALRPDDRFMIKMRDSDPDWEGTEIGFELEPLDSGTTLRFSHTGWPEDNAHFRTSSYCWAMYLRCLKLWIEDGIEISYDKRFDGRI